MKKSANELDIRDAYQRQVDIIEKELRKLQAENIRLSALAEFGREVLDSSDQLSRIWIIPIAVKHGLLTDRDWEETDLAKLPGES